MARQSNPVTQALFAVLLLLATFWVSITCVAQSTTRTPPIFSYDPTQMQVGLTGKVTLPDGLPAAGAIVELVNGMEADTSATVQSDGTFALPYPVSMVGSPSIRIRMPAFATERFEYTRGVLPDVQLRPAVSVSGRILSTSGDPLPNINMTLSTVTHRRGPKGEYISLRKQSEGPTAHEKQQTDADGNFNFNTLTPGDYNIQAYGQGLTAYTAEVKAPAAGLEITLTSGTGIVRGYTLDYATSQPLAGTTVTISRSRVPAHGSMISLGQTTVSDSAGFYEFTGLEYTYYSLTARREGMLEVPAIDTASAITDPSGAWLSNRWPVADVNIRLYPGHRVSGVVRDGRTSQPLAGVEVSALSINNKDVITQTDAGGRYSLEHVVGGGGDRLFLQAKKEGYEYATTGGGGTKIREVILGMYDTDVAVDVDLYPEEASR